jgi:Tol biopolymer transport system component
VVNIDDKKPRSKILSKREDNTECIFSWGPDGSKLAYAGVFILGVHPEVRAYNIKIPTAYGAPSWSSDGAWIATAGAPKLFAKTSIYRASSDGKQIIKLTNDGGDYNPVWAPK